MSEDVVSYVAKQLSREVISAMVDEKAIKRERSLISSQGTDAEAMAQ